MKNLLLFLFLLLSIITNAQEGSHNVQLILEPGTPIGPFSAPFSKPGIGAYIRGEYSFGVASKITFQAGAARFGQKDIYKPPTAAYYWPLLLGYKHTIKRFYIEPQLGYGWGYETGLSGYYRDEGGQFTTGYFAIGSGYSLNQKFSVGIRYQQATQDFAVEDFSFIGIHVSYKVLSAKK